MPWTKTDYPNSMKNLPAAVRNKAIEIANALLEDRKMEEGIAIATAISRAKDWAAEHGKKTDNPEKSKRTDVKVHGQDRYVIPYEKEWAIKVEGREKVEKVFHTKQEAVKQARRETKEVNGTLTIQRKTGKIEKRISYNPKNKG
ncbi:DUF2188 domain-containing protein [Sinomicrobium pectinilyticum]|uniref:DUF2188 domain-containing protein n=1 Tax=Sinomicrobium pectinilyticum TaxID=1084421 RepID=A0A3N0ES15_SINP1|nr:DUF2188 domain-containing protein [Sinomicrobium pectinilyticum]RNL90718.1 DUF2188 domain-containing protein [Sinomicrobium pectinilyticum]